MHGQVNIKVVAKWKLLWGTWKRGWTYKVHLNERVPDEVGGSARVFGLSAHNPLVAKIFIRARTVDGIWGVEPVGDEVGKAGGGVAGYPCVDNVVPSGVGLERIPPRLRRHANPPCHGRVGALDCDPVACPRSGQIDIYP